MTVPAYLEPTTQAEKRTGEYRSAAVVYTVVSYSGRNRNDMSEERRTAGEPELGIWPSADEIGKVLVGEHVTERLTSKRGQQCLRIFSKLQSKSVASISPATP